MPIVRLSGTVKGRKDPNRQTRARMLYRLFDAGWDIYNGNGDQVITLVNIQNKITESDAFMFMPGVNMEDMFNAASIFVGFQTNDGDLKGKSAVILNSDHSWDSFINLMIHLHELGTVKQHPYEFLTIVDKPKMVLKKLEEDYQERLHVHQPEHFLMPKDPSREAPLTASGTKSKPAFSICVFCSASIKRKEHLDAGYNLGKYIAEAGWGCISGAGRTGIMGQIVKGANENGGWTGGSNVPHIIEMEGLPDGMDEFWPRPDIYTRMEIMIDKSDAFVAMPGGMGTVQEVLALIILKEQSHDLMKDKPIIIVNSIEPNGIGFWTPLLDIIQKYGVSDMFSVVNSGEEVVPEIRKWQEIEGRG